MRSSLLVAESLRVIALPNSGSLPPFDTGGGDALPLRWRQAWAPGVSSALPPACLRPDQVTSWRRVIAALDTTCAAILAEPVGSGKSWMAMAAAIHYGCHTMVIGPARLERQWRAVALRAGVAITWTSHERLSRGCSLPDNASLVIIDEAHRFRHLTTRRVATLAPWLSGRRTLLLTATPIINRRADLVALLRLILPDDALRLDGLQSLRDIADMPTPPAALARVVIRSSHRASRVPLAIRRLPCNRDEELRANAAVEVVARLTLSDTKGVRNLLTTVLLDAAASSDAAWRSALRRYRALLLQSRDAGGLSRAALRQFAGPSLDQLVLWPLLGDLPVAGAPCLADIDVVAQALATEPRGEPWLGAVRELLADGRPTVCFARHRATAAALASELGDGTAWINGSGGGIGALRLDRDQVLAAFGTRREQWRLLRSVPTCLVATEVVSEGLDLQGASRVVHIDLPWHAARLDQRVGRVRRLGQMAAEVEVATREVPRAIERVLGVAALIRTKGRLANRWLDRLTVDVPSEVANDSTAWLAVALPDGSGVEGRALVGLSAGDRIGTVALELVAGAWRPATAVPTEPPQLIAEHEMSGMEQIRLRGLARRAAWRALELARPQVVSRPRLVGRLLSLGRAARIARDRDRLERLDTLLTVASRALPLGGAAQVDALAVLPDPGLLSARVTPPAPSPAGRVEWLVVVQYRGA